MPKSRLKLPPLKLATDETAGARLARLRKERGLTQTELAKKIGIIQGLVTNYECDELRMHGEMVVRFAQALGITADELLGMTTPREVSGKLSLKVIRRLSKIETLPDSKQRAVLQALDTLLKGAGA